MTPSGHDASRPAAPRGDRDRYAALAFCWADLLLNLDANGAIQFAAGPFKAFLGRGSAALAGTPVATLFEEDDAEVIGRCLNQALSHGRIDGERVHLIRPKGLPLPMEVAAYGLDGQIYMALKRRPATPPQAAEKETHDERSGLLTPEAFGEMAGRRARSLAEAGRDVGVTWLDLKGFEALRERMTEADANGLMRSVGDSLRAAAVDSEGATQISESRYGLLHDKGLDIAALEERLRTLASRHDPEGRGIDVESASVDLDQTGALSEEDLVRGLVYAMNHLQEQNGAGASLRDLPSNLTELVAKATDQVNDFRRMVAERKFFVALQPIIGTTSGIIHHYEALVRFDPAAPDASPFRLITFAEETGLIHEFDLAMAYKVIEWLAEHGNETEGAHIAVNVSGYSIGVDSYVQGLFEMLQAHPWTRGRLLFEITESSRMTDLKGANQFIQALRAMRYQVCLDDFGAGAASFQYLSALDVDVVKIDGSAVRNAMNGTKGKAFLSALTELCRRLSVRTIAEMIDSPQSLQFVRACGCDYVQGFLFGRPSPTLKTFSPLPGAELFPKQERRRPVEAFTPFFPSS
ncbi:EAL domain-containing protein [Pararhodospirillum photometricum]|nr:EAL domain-containing protein [Pararhodospirillum photometricum]